MILQHELYAIACSRELKVRRKIAGFVETGRRRRSFAGLAIQEIKKVRIQSQPEIKTNM
jgi:hypothetical protein